MNREVKATIERNAASLRTMFPDASPDVIRRAVYADYYVDTRANGQVVLKIRGRGRAREVPHYLMRTLRGDIPEEIQHPRGDHPPPEVRARRRAHF